MQIIALPGLRTDCLAIGFLVRPFLQLVGALKKLIIRMEKKLVRFMRLPACKFRLVYACKSNCRQTILQMGSYFEQLDVHKSSKSVWMDHRWAAKGRFAKINKFNIIINICPNGIENFKYK